MTKDLRFPAGPFQAPKSYEKKELDSFIEVIALFPGRLESEISKLKPESLDTPYRPGGWTVRQVVHHCADSHMNSFIRFKLALTEDNPTIKPYFEDKWAEMEDYLNVPLIHSLKILDGVHFRWVALLRSMTEQDFQKAFFHPEKQRSITLYEATALYAWHCKHHLAHVMLVTDPE
jgi:hypothetical protein